jgi:hypothetical protein
MVLVTGCSWALLAAISSGRCQAQDGVSADQTRQIRRIAMGIDRAGRLYTSGKMAESAELIRDLAAELEKLVEGASDELLAVAKPQHDRLAQARKLLVEAGQTLPEIAALPMPAALEGDTLRFSADIAPILATRCGACHMDQARGEFSMATFQALAAGVGGAPVIVPGKPDESHLIELVEAGTMPPMGTKVPPEELARLKQWITEGANFDLDDPAASIRETVAAIREAMDREDNPEISAPTGNETVSFSLHVAPVLVENCAGCHFEAQNARGGLRMDNFRQLLRGGDGGPVVIAGDPENSPIIQRLTASDANVRMPQGRPALDPQVIERISQWIREGAVFDARDAQMNLRELSAIARSMTSTHEELAAARLERARANWKKVMTDVPANEVVVGDFLVVGTPDAEQLTEVAGFAAKQVETLRHTLGIAEGEPLVKGQITLYVFERRYDYNEFGKMIENRDLPQDWHLHWGYDVVDAWIAMQVTDQGLDADEAQLQQSLAALSVAAAGAEVPEWFADGAGYLVGEAVVRNSRIVEQWQDAALAAASQMQNPTDFLQDRMPRDQAGLVGYGFLRSLFSSREQFGEFLAALRSGEPFGDVFRAGFGRTPAQIVEGQSGDGGGNGKANGKRRGNGKRGKKR